MAGTSGNSRADVLVSRAFQAQHENRLEDAVRFYDQALSSGVESVELFFNLAIIHHRLGGLSQAISCLRKSIALSSVDPALHNNLGGMLLENNETDAAARAFNAALAIDHGYRSALFNLGNLEQKRGRLSVAVKCFRRIIDQYGADFETINNLASALIELGDSRGAIALLEQFCSQHPDPRSYNNYGLALRANGNSEAAAAAFQRALTLDEEFADAHTNYGNLLLKQGSGDEALLHLRRAVEISPDTAQFHVNLGNALLSIGRFSEAESVLQHAVAIDPCLTTAKRHIALIGGRRNLAAQIDECNQLLQQPDLPVSERTHLHFALGKFYDETGEYDLSFSQYRLGNAMVRKNLNFNVEKFSQDVDTSLSFFNAERLANTVACGNSSTRPVFVVGMPRSGTSLVEQVLASHSQVVGVGEISFFAELEKRLTALTCDGPYPGCVEYLRESHIIGIADEYLGILDRCCDDACRYVIDKLPSNALRLGLIQLVLPKTRIIYCTRDVKDVGLSNYFQYFTGRQDFAYDLYELGVAIRVHERAMAHWRQHSSLPILEIPYEQMVSQLELTIRHMLDFLDLPFDPCCLEFHKTQRTVRTASSWQVRQPLYTSAVRRWRNYSKHLTALDDGLAV